MHSLRLFLLVAATRSVLAGGKLQLYESSTCEGDPVQHLPVIEGANDDCIVGSPAPSPPDGVSAPSPPSAAGNSDAIAEVQPTLSIFHDWTNSGDPAWASFPSSIMSAEFHCIHGALTVRWYRDNSCAEQSTSYVDHYFHGECRYLNGKSYKLECTEDEGTTMIMRILIAACGMVFVMAVVVAASSIRNLDCCTRIGAWPCQIWAMVLIRLVQLTYVIIACIAVRQCFAIAQTVRQTSMPPLPPTMPPSPPAMPPLFPPPQFPPSSSDIAGPTNITTPQHPPLPLPPPPPPSPPTPPAPPTPPSPPFSPSPPSPPPAPPPVPPGNPPPPPQAPPGGPYPHSPSPSPPSPSPPPCTVPRPPPTPASPPPVPPDVIVVSEDDRVYVVLHACGPDATLPTGCTLLRPLLIGTAVTTAISIVGFTVYLLVALVLALARLRGWVNVSLATGMAFVLVVVGMQAGVALLCIGQFCDAFLDQAHKNFAATYGGDRDYALRVARATVFLYGEHWATSVAGILAIVAAGCTLADGCIQLFTQQRSTERTCAQGDGAGSQPQATASNTNGQSAEPTTNKPQRGIFPSRMRRGRAKTSDPCDSNQPTLQQTSTATGPVVVAPPSAGGSTCAGGGQPQPSANPFFGRMGMGSPGDERL